MTRRAVRDKTYTAKGDLFIATADDTATRLPIGTNGQVLTVDTTTTTGLKWGAGLSALDWQESVLDKDLVAAPAAVTGDRYIVGTPVAGGDPWFGHEDDIAEYDGTGWDFLTPDDGTATYVEDEEAFYVWSGTAWIQLWAKEYITEITAVGPTGMNTNKGYIANNIALVTLTLPVTAVVGDFIEVIGSGAGGWTIAQNAGQEIHVGNVVTTNGVGGSLSSTQDHDSVTLVCLVADTTFVATDIVGALVVV